MAAIFFATGSPIDGTQEPSLGPGGGRTIAWALTREIRVHLEEDLEYVVIHGGVSSVSPVCSAVHSASIGKGSRYDYSGKGIERD